MSLRYLTLDDLASDSATAQLAALGGGVKRELLALVGRIAPPSLPGRGVVVLTAAQVFHRRLTLPRAVLPTLGPLLAADFDRLTPFTRDQAYGDAQITLAETGPLTVDLWAAPRAVLDPLFAEAARRGRPATGVLVPGAVRALRFGRQTPPAAGRGRAALTVIGIATALAMTGAGWLWPTWERGQAVARLRGEIDGVRQVLEATHAQASTAQAADAWASTHAPVLPILADLTDAVPDTTHLTALTLRGDRIELAGISTDPAALLTALSAHSGFSGVQFAAPLVSEAGGTRFALRLTRTIPEILP